MQGYELYELSLKQEVLTEKAAEILGDIFRCIYRLDPQNMAKQKDDITAVNVLDAIYESVWLLKHNTALAKRERELEIINNQLDFAADTVKRVSQVVFGKAGGNE